MTESSLNTMIVSFLVVGLILLVVSVKNLNHQVKEIKNLTVEQPSNVHSHYQLFSTHTSYDAVRGDGIKEQPGCKAKAIWGFLRHGARFPFYKDIRKIKKLFKLRDQILANHLMRKGMLSPSQLKSLKEWDFKVTSGDSMQMTSSGFKELISLGKRLLIAFPHLLNINQLPHFNIKVTTAFRTQESAAALAEGLTGEPITLTTIDDRLLRKSYSCPFWSFVSGNDSLKEQTEKLKGSKTLKSLIKNVSRRLGFHKDLSYDMINGMYQTCGFETAWYTNKNSTWCAAFSTEELQFLEYERDLYFYWRSGYGNPYTKKIGCELLQDMFTKLDKYEGPVNVNLNFAHETGIRHLVVSLGIAKCQKHLTADGYVGRADMDACWRTSYLIPFAANLLSVLYSCRTEDKGDESLRVGIFLNEKVIPLCHGKDLCDFEEFKNRYASLTNNKFCNQGFCSMSESKFDFDYSSL